MNLNVSNVSFGQWGNSSYLRNQILEANKDNSVSDKRVTEAKKDYFYVHNNTKGHILDFNKDTFMLTDRNSKLKIVFPHNKEDKYPALDVVKKIANYFKQQSEEFDTKKFFNNCPVIK